MALRSLVAALAAAALLAGAGGCGTDDEQEVRDTLARFERATADHDFEALCDGILSRDLVERITRVFPTCEAALRRSVLAELRQPVINVGRVRVRGDRAFAQVTTSAVGQTPARVTIELVKQDDDWRLSSLAGAQPPTPPRTPEQEHERQEGEGQ
jgi:hypothetical protein